MEGSGRELEFVETLGSGGFGSVYLANLHGRDRFVRRVAVKVMREGLDGTPELVARQKDEARLLGLLAHDAIVQVLDLAEVNGRPAVVMEYVEGVDLSELLRRLGQGRLSRKAALEVVAAVAGALDAAWSAPSPITGGPLRVIHRDIKPANILVTSYGRVKVLDFGVAKADFARDGRSTNAGWGTPRFMAPEQWLGESYGAPIDIYALGVTLFELVADRPWDRPPLARTPFESQVGAQLAAQAAVPGPILDLVAEMTAFEAADRPTAAQVHDRAVALAAETDGEPLVRIARRDLPAILDLRRKELAQSPLPGTLTLDGLSPVRTASPPEEPSLRRPPLRLALLAGWIGAAALFGLGAIGLGIVAWRIAASRTAEPEPPAEPVATVVPAPAPAPVVTTADTPTDAAPPAAAPVADPTPTRPGSAGTTRASRTTSEPDNPRISATPPAAAVAAATPATVVTSDPAPAVVAAPPSASTPAPTPAATRAATWPLDVSSVPIGAEVWLDGAMVGRTPLVDLPLTAGTHTVVLNLGGQVSTSQPVTGGANTPAGLRFYFTDSTWKTLR